MMDDARSERWKSPHLALELQRKLCGDGEYENYRASMWAIHDNFATMSTRLKAFEISVRSPSTGPIYDCAVAYQTLDIER